MAKKVKNSKLLRQTQATPETGERKVGREQKKSVFNSFAENLQMAKHKKIEKLNETKNRLMNKKK